MLTRPEINKKQLLLICVEPGTKSIIQLKNKNILYKRDDEVVNQSPIDRVLHLMIIGDITLTTNLIRELTKFGTTVSLLKPNLEQYADFGFETQANFLLRKQQYKLTDTQNFNFAKSIIKDKINNQKVVLNRVHSDEGIVILDRFYNLVDETQTPKELLGIEGSASKAFFIRYFELYSWTVRSPRTKIDPVNYLLDIGYTVLFNFVDAICRHFGLDTYKGVYHTQFFARKSLICDLMEPFRCLIDNRTHTALNLNIFKSEMFKHKQGSVYTDWVNSKIIVKTYADEVMKNREEIFLYIKGFYRNIMDEKNDKPSFRLGR